MRVYFYHDKLPDTVFDLDPQTQDQQIAELVRQGWRDTPPAQKSRHQMLVDAIDRLNPENPEHYTTTGIPRVEAVETFSGLIEVKAHERDEAFQTYWDGQ